MINFIHYIYRFSNHFINWSLTKPKKNAKNILIYSDHGVSPYSAFGLFLRTKKLVKKSPYNVKLVNSDYLKNEMWESKTALLIMPGGRARPYYDSLGASWETRHVPQGQTRKLREIGEGNQRIHRFVTQNGGNFFGVCAGAYYASELTLFEKGGPLEVIDEGPLKFFSGIAEGPAYGLGKFSYHTQSGAQLAQIAWKEAEEEKAGHVYYNGGCFFYAPSKSENYQVLARYNNIPEKPAAVIACQLNQGRVILSGVHFETSHQFFPLLSKRNPIFYNELKKHTPFQIYSLHKILKNLNIQVEPEDGVSVPFLSSQEYKK